mmetsp:Transcript_35131/g.85377  ORF Transcript_35131/g.85377 Transcript_35131/m.85377 type:complete len:187 (+) Transcript_35131:406-966(+)
MPEPPREASVAAAVTGSLVSDQEESSSRNEFIGISQRLHKKETAGLGKNAKEDSTQIFSIRSLLTSPNVTSAHSFPATLPSCSKKKAHSFNDLAELDRTNSSSSFSNSRTMARSFVQLSSLAQSQIEKLSLSPSSAIDPADHWQLDAWRQHTKIRRPAASAGCKAPPSAKMLLCERASASSDMVFC